jgi:hypothetical protein
VPQITKAWSGPVPGMSISTWVMFSGFGLIWLVYAVIHGQKPLIVAQVVGLLCNVSVVVGWIVNTH